MDHLVPHAARRRACLQIASAPEVPFCAAARVATVVVLARHSVLGRRREIADFARIDIRRRYQSLRSPAVALCAGTTHPVTSLLAKVACARNGTCGRVDNPCNKTSGHLDDIDRCRNVCLTHARQHAPTISS